MINANISRSRGKRKNQHSGGIENCRTFFLSFLINRGQNTEFILEIFAEILGVVKAQLIRYLRYILLTLAQHLRRSFQTDDTDKFNRCLTGYLQEFLVKMYQESSTPVQAIYNITVEPNTTPDVRNAIITVSVKEHIQEINVEQAAYIQSDEPEKYTVRENLTTHQLINEMGLGINLGNTLDAVGDWIDPSNILNYPCSRAHWAAGRRASASAACAHRPARPWAPVRPARARPGPSARGWR